MAPIAILKKNGVFCDAGQCGCDADGDGFGCI